MPSIAEMQTKAGQIAKQIQDLGATYDHEKKEWPNGAETEATWVNLNKQYDDLGRAIEDQKKADISAQVKARLESIQAGAALDVAPLSDHLAAGGTHPAFAPPDASMTPRQRKAVEARAWLKECGVQTQEEILNLGLVAWFKGDQGASFNGEISDQEFAACAALGINPTGGGITFNLPLGSTRNINSMYRKFANTHPGRRDLEDFMGLPYYNAPLTTTTPASGGNIVPPETMLRRIEVNMLWFGGMREVSQLMQTASGEKMTWPTADDTGNQARIIPENTAADDNAGGGTSGDGGPNPTFAKSEWGAYKMTSDTILIPFELIQDNVLGEGLLLILADMLGERIGRFSNNKYTVGSGTGEPTGIVTVAPAGVTGVAVAGPTWEQTIELEHSVDLAYRQGAAYMANDSTVLFLRKLKDGQGRPIWQNGLQDGVPDTLNGRRIITNNDMPAIAASAKPMIFGQLSAYKIRRAGTLRMYRLEERYREKDQTGLVAFLREDGNLLNTGTAPVKHMAQAAT